MAKHGFKVFDSARAYNDWRHEFCQAEPQRMFSAGMISVIHSEDTLGERAVALIVRSERSGDFMQGRYQPETNRYWQGYGPRQIRLPFLAE